MTKRILFFFLLFSSNFLFCNSKWVYKGSKEIKTKYFDFNFVLEEKCEVTNTGECLYDDGQVWRLILYYDNKPYTVFEEYVQSDQVYFTVRNFLGIVFVYINGNDFKICKRIINRNSQIEIKNIFKFWVK